MKNILVLALLTVFAGMSLADITETYGWEDTGTLLGMYPDSGVVASLVTNPVHGGIQSLEIERLSDGTPQAYVAWIKDLSDGDSVSVSLWIYDDTPDVSPKGRIWAHWNDDPNDVNGYNGSASGPDPFTSGTGWEASENTWIVADGHTGIVIEARVYSDPGAIIWVDDITVTAPDGATIVLPGVSALENTTWADIKAAF